MKKALFSKKIIFTTTGYTNAQGCIALRHLIFSNSGYGIHTIPPWKLCSYMPGLQVLSSLVSKQSYTKGTVINSIVQLITTTSTKTK